MPPPPLPEFLRLFESGAYWESHEALEEAWRENGSGFYKALILVASAFVHVHRGNPHGIDAQLRKAERELRPYSPVYLGVDVRALLDHAAAARRVVSRHREDAGADWPALVPPPSLEFSSRWLRGDEPELRG